MPLLPSTTHELRYPGRMRYFSIGAFMLLAVLVPATFVTAFPAASAMIPSSASSNIPTTATFGSHLGNNTHLGNGTGPSPQTINGGCGSSCPDAIAVDGSAQHSFTGAVTSESGYQWEDTYTTTSHKANDYEAVLSTQEYSCSVGGGTSCQEIWVYVYDAGTAYGEMEQWIYGVSGSCPTGFSSLGGGTCIAVAVTPNYGSAYDVAPGSLVGFSLEGYSSSTSDWIQVCYSSSCSSQQSTTDYVAAYNSWTEADFNIAGDPGVSGADTIAAFNAGTSLTLTETAGSGSVSASTGNFIVDALDMNPSSHSTSSSTLTYTENNLPSISSVTTSSSACLPTATCSHFATYCTAATSCSVTATIATGDLVVMGFQAPSGTITAADSLINGNCAVGGGYSSCEEMEWSSQTVNGEAFGISDGFGVALGGSDTFTVSTTGTAGTIGIEVAETPNGIAYGDSIASAYQTYSGTSSGCASATSICINSVITPSDSVNLAFASIYAAPASGGVTTSSPYTADCATQNSARCMIWADDLSTSSATQFPATDAVSASYWGDAGWVWDV